VEVWVLKNTVEPPAEMPFCAEMPSRAPGCSLDVSEPIPIPLLSRRVPLLSTPTRFNAGEEEPAPVIS
jgi:hypothetical protein